jgi:hypothetical protein
VMCAAGSKHENQEERIGNDYGNSKSERYNPFHGKSPKRILYTAIVFFTSAR